MSARCHTRQRFLKMDLSSPAASARLNVCLLLGIACGGPQAFGGNLQLVPEKQMQCVMAGETRTITVVWRNASDEVLDVEIHLRLYQASSATVAPLADRPWKRIEILPGQTVLESVQLHFPAVNTETRFLIQWLAGTNQVIGLTQVLVYPTNLLAAFKAMAGPGPMGVLDPQGQLKALLKAAGVEFEDLGCRELGSFPGRLAILGPFRSPNQYGTRFVDRVRKLAAKGVAVVWIVPPTNQASRLKPSFYPLPFGTGNVVVAQATLIPDLADNPVSQLHLIRLVELALKPEPLDLPLISQNGE
jgi:hypothetical protein